MVYLYYLQSNPFVVTTILNPFWSFIGNLATLVLGGASVYIAWKIHKSDIVQRKTDEYLYKIIELTFVLYESYKLLLESDDEFYKNKVKITVRALRHYIDRFPDRDCRINELDGILNDIWFEPDNKNYYDAYLYEFESFCLRVNANEQRPISSELMENGKIRYIQN